MCVRNLKRASRPVVLNQYIPYSSLLKIRAEQSRRNLDNGRKVKEDIDTGHLVNN
jgi:hypothetical protein